MIYLLDTNILLAYARQSKLVNYINEKFRPFSLGNSAITPVVCPGEVRAIALRNKWGKRRLAELPILFDQFVIADINVEDIITRYAEIDAYSQGKLAGRSLNDSARNMGKNDLWRSAVAIAATGSVLKATLLTTDGDFNHLTNGFLIVNHLIQKELGF